MKTQYLDIDYDPSTHYLTLYGVRAGLDMAHNQTVRNEKRERELEIREQAAADAHLRGEQRESDANRVLLAGALMLSASLAVFVVTACVIGGAS